jgi:outer membrane biosynthesis protein TonB
MIGYACVGAALACMFVAAYVHTHETKTPPPPVVTEKPVVPPAPPVVAPKKPQAPKAKPKAQPQPPRAPAAATPLAP